MVRSQVVNVTIGKLAQMAGVGVETIRYYQRRGLLGVPALAGGGEGGRIRRYGPRDLERLNFIRSAQAAGFTLNEINILLKHEGASDKAEVRKLAQQRIEQLDLQIAEMTRARAGLARLAQECAALEDEPNAPCPILRAFEDRTDCC